MDFVISFISLVSSSNSFCTGEFTSNRNDITGGLNYTQSTYFCWSRTCLICFFSCIFTQDRTTILLQVSVSFKIVSRVPERNVFVRHA